MHPNINRLFSGLLDYRRFGISPGFSIFFKFYTKIMYPRRGCLLRGLRVSRGSPCQEKEVEEEEAGLP